jgi:hypothetical protein
VVIHIYVSCIVSYKMIKTQIKHPKKHFRARMTHSKIEHYVPDHCHIESQIHTHDLTLQLHKIMLLLYEK